MKWVKNKRQGAKPFEKERTIIAEPRKPFNERLFPYLSTEKLGNWNLLKAIFKRIFIIPQNPDPIGTDFMKLDNNHRRNRFRGVKASADEWKIKANGVLLLFLKKDFRKNLSSGIILTLGIQIKSKSSFKNFLNDCIHF